MCNHSPSGVSLSLLPLFIIACSEPVEDPQKATPQDAVCEEDVKAMLQAPIQDLEKDPTARHGMRPVAAQAR